MAAALGNYVHPGSASAFWHAPGVSLIWRRARTELANPYGTKAFAEYATPSPDSIHPA